jgi:hypothetical protein
MYQGLTISILYSKDFNSDMNEIEDILQKLGHKVICKEFTKEHHTQIISHSKYASYESAKVLKRKIPTLQKAQFNISLDNHICGESDFTLVFSN